ncbi:hypothetical protein M9H77_06573 [Catharanthus roseus]|uniref:Uncharacterized protein n=1 Tax=Catharanthus roseus TaxID=4058 RepID=A0ACC0BSH2_CATRO|nr:hypothetical protein M9H77_06573 [Catharanthus roseus]
MLDHAAHGACYVCDCIVCAMWKIDKNVVDDTIDKYDESNVAQSSKKVKKSWKSNVWYHTRRLDISKDGEPRVECLGCGKMCIAGEKYGTSSISRHVKMMRRRRCYQVDSN